MTKYSFPMNGECYGPLMIPSHPSWGLVLSGGVAFGTANVGVLHALEKAGLRPDCLAGSSMGAIVGALWACGYSSEEMASICKELTIPAVATWSAQPFKNGLHGGLLRQRLTEHLEPLLGTKTIADCSMPFICIAGRVIKPVDWLKITRKTFIETLRESVEPYVFPPETRLVDALLATSAMPVIFSPVRIGNDSFIDLVGFGAIPSRTLRKECHPDVVIGTDTNETRSIPAFLPEGVRNFMAEGEKSLQESRDACDLLIVPALPKGQSWRFDKTLTFIDAGKTATEKRLPEIRELLRR